MIEWIKVIRLIRQIERSGFVWSLQRHSDGYVAEVETDDVMLGDCDMPGQATASDALNLAYRLCRESNCQRTIEHERDNLKCPMDN